MLSNQPLAASQPQPPTTTAQLIVCEHTGRWAIALRRELESTGVRIHETRSFKPCWEILVQSPASFILAELTTRTSAELLDRLARLPRDFPAARAAVVADRRLADYQWLMREAGAVHFTCSPRQLGTLARLACRHLAQTPAPRQTVAEGIWSSLPWRKPPACD